MMSKRRLFGLLLGLTVVLLCVMILTPFVFIPIAREWVVMNHLRSVSQEIPVIPGSKLLASVEEFPPTLDAGCRSARISQLYGVNDLDFDAALREFESRFRGTRWQRTYKDNTELIATDGDVGLSISTHYRTVQPLAKTLQEEGGKYDLLLLVALFRHIDPSAPCG